MKFSNLKDVEQYLQAIPDFRSEGAKAADFSLERFRDFCDELGNPHQSFPTIHVAGSNGKGSTCHILAAIYRQSGLKVGVYTSPHICSFTERFTINGVEIDPEALVNFFNKYQGLIKRYRLTYFEISTAIAFWWFSRQEVSLGIIEVGLGGRLDATNIITPLATVITSISMDHTDILGDTLQAIAREKAGTIKPGVPVVIGVMPRQAEQTIREVAARQQSNVYGIRHLHPQWEQGTYQLFVGKKTIQLASPLQGPIQAYNIALAWQVIQRLKERFPLNKKHLRQGLQQVQLPAARFERLAPTLDWYFDGAHNLEAVRALKQAIETIQPVDQTVLVLSLMKDKINKKMMKEFLEFKKIAYYTLSVERAATIREIARWLPRVEPFPEEQGARQRLLKEFSSQLVIFTGSFYFYPTVRDWLSTFVDR